MPKDNIYTFCIKIAPQYGVRGHIMLEEITYTKNCTYTWSVWKLGRHEELHKCLDSMHAPMQTSSSVYFPIPTFMVELCLYKQQFGPQQVKSCWPNDCLTDNYATGFCLAMRLYLGATALFNNLMLVLGNHGCYVSACILHLLPAPHWASPATMVALSISKIHPSLFICIPDHGDGRWKKKKNEGATGECGLPLENGSFKFESQTGRIVEKERRHQRSHWKLRVTPIPSSKASV